MLQIINDCIALKEVRVLYVDNTVVMMKWIHIR